MLSVIVIWKEKDEVYAARYKNKRERYLSGRAFQQSDHESTVLGLEIENRFPAHHRIESMTFPA